MKQKGEEKIIKNVTEKYLKEETKKYSIKEGVAASIMSGSGGSYMTPYALAIGANNAQIGLLSSIPSLLANLSQLFTAKAIEKYSRKKIIVLGVFLQALMWIPMIAVGYLFFYKNLNHGLSATLLIAFFTLYSLFGSFLSPAWNSMMKDNIANKEEGKYFGRRNRINGAVSLIVFMGSGVLLNHLTQINLFVGFFILFAISFLSRMTSGFLITKHYDPKLKLEKGYYFSFFQFVKRIPESNFGKFTVFIGLIVLATNIASPFFTVYMLKDLQFSYATWMLIVVSGSVSSLMFMPLWGKFADKFGNLKVLRFTGAFIFLIPLLWLFLPFLGRINPMFVVVFLLAEEFFSNFIWSGFNLCTTNFIYDAVTRERLALCVAYFNIFNGAGVFIGATLGGLVSSMNFNFFGLNPLLFIFLLSGLVRLAVYIFMISKIREVREVEKYRKGALKKEIEQMFIPAIHSRFNNFQPYGHHTIMAHDLFK